VNFPFEIIARLLIGWTNQAFEIACIGAASRAHHLKMSSLFVGLFALRPLPVGGTLARSVL
jgi:hypothetical protein